MNHLITCSLFIILTFQTFAQSKKEVKAHKIKASMTTIIENGKTINDAKTLFDAKGNEIEKTEYNKEGAIKSVHKFKYNSDGDELEDEQYDATNKLVEKKQNDNLVEQMNEQEVKHVEKKITKYKLLGEKTEEAYFDGLGKSTKKHTYVYDGKGLKTERKTLDADGKVISVKKHVYVTK